MGSDPAHLTTKLMRIQVRGFGSRSPHNLPVRTSAGGWVEVDALAEGETGPTSDVTIFDDAADVHSRHGVAVCVVSVIYDDAADVHSRHEVADYTLLTLPTL